MELAACPTAHSPGTATRRTLRLPATLVLRPQVIAEVISHETGHSLGLAHDGQFRFYTDIAEDPPENVRLFVEYYGGHGAGQTAWAPIMGVGYGKYLTQWSQGEYFNATNDEAGANPLQDDLEIITNTGGNGFRLPHRRPRQHDRDGQRPSSRTPSPPILTRACSRARASSSRTPTSTSSRSPSRVWVSWSAWISSRFTMGRI